MRPHNAACQTRNRKSYIMFNATWLPDGENDRLQWFDRFSNALGGAAATVSVAAPEVVATRADYVWYAFTVQQVEVFKAELRERVSYKDLLRDGPIGEPTLPAPSIGSTSFPVPPPVAPGILPRLRSLVNRIRNSPNYTDSIGQDLGIVPPATPVAAVIKPLAEAFALPNSEVKLTVVKKGFKAVLVETQRAAETTWESLGVKLRAQCIDARPPLVPGLPEVRRYRFRYMDGDTPVGDYSSVETVTTIP